MARNTKNGTDGKVSIDYPLEHEKIASPQYTFRINTEIEGNVEVSVDGGPWSPCRPSVGYWWFDWNAEKKTNRKTHKLQARVRTQTGEALLSQARPFETPVTHTRRAKAGVK